MSINWVIAIYRLWPPPHHPLSLFMKLRIKVESSSPIKQQKQQSKYEESSDWSLSSPSSDKLVTSPRRVVSSPRRTASNRQTVVTSSSPTLTRSSSPLTEASTFSEVEEVDEKDSLELPKFKATCKRPFLVQEDDSSSEMSYSDNETIETEDKEMIDIMTDLTEDIEMYPATSYVTNNEISDPSLQGLLEDEEIDLEEAFIDDSDRKLYEMAFNRAEITSSSHQNMPISASDGMFKGNRIKSSTKHSSTGGRGKGKDLFSVLKQRARGPKVPSIRKIYFGTDVAINPWYSAPYPSEYHSETGELWICEFCLQYMKNPCTAQRHLLKCHGCLPPGDEIYRDPVAGISVFEINGREAKLYCQNLCLLAKMFLDHKTLYYDVDPFLFYVLIEWKALGTGRYLNSFVGYFSKEKINPAGFNVSCILTMPHHQRKGYGSFLIDFSYLLSRKEGRLGSPEKPLSDLGLFSYVSYWKTRLLAYFSSLLPENLGDKSVAIESPSLSRISAATGMTENDILSTLEYLRMLRFDIVTPDPSQPTRQSLLATILIDYTAVENYRIKIASRPQLVAHDEYLRWQPYKCTK